MGSVTGAVLAYIPSPSSGTFSLGPLTLHMYGVMLLLAIAACIWLTGRRWVAMGGDWDLVFRVAVWGVIAGVIGARIYHLITSWNQDPAIIAGRVNRIDALTLGSIKDTFNKYYPAERMTVVTLVPAK